MTRRTVLSMLGLALLALSFPAAVSPVFAKDGAGGGDGGGDKGTEGGDGKDDKTEGEDGSTSSSSTDQPGTEAQPEDATQCAAGTDCTPK